MFGRGFISHEYDLILREFFDAAEKKGDLPLKFNVNKIFRAGEINVYVLESANRNRKIKIKSIGVSYDKALRNVLALPPDKIIVGEEYLADLLLNFINSSSMFAEMLTNYLETDDPSVIIKSWAMINYLRYGNILNSINRWDMEEHPTTIVPKQIEAIENSENGNVREAFLEAFYHGLLFIFAHEVSHLKEDFSGGLVDIWELVKRYRRGIEKKEEIRADENARKIVRNSLAKSDHVISPMSLASLAAYFRDYMNIQMFEELRQVNTRELFFTLLQEPCNSEELGIYGARLDNIYLIKGGYWNVFPILTRQEYHKVKRKLNRIELSATHEHNFFRTGKIMADLKTFGINAPNSPIQPFISFYKSIIADKPYVHNDSILGKTSITEKEFITALGEWTNLEDSPVCQVGLICKSGRYQEGYIDLVLKDGVVKYAVIYFPMERLDMNFEEAKAEVPTYRLAEMMKLYFDLRGYTRDPSVTDEAFFKTFQTEFMKIRSDNLFCGFYSQFHANQYNALEVSTIRTKSWIRFKLFSAQLDIPHL